MGGGDLFLSVLVLVLLLHLNTCLKKKVYNNTNNDSEKIVRSKYFLPKFSFKLWSKKLH